MRGGRPAGVGRARAAAHRARVEELIGPYLRQRAAGSKHPVIDFLFTYYGHKPAQLRRWHPGFGVALENAHEYANSRGYRHVRPDAGGAPAWTADPAFVARRRDTIEFVAKLLRATGSRAPQLSCFGLHEWAMVYRSDDVRHSQVPLRLGRTGTDAVVESMPLRCTHSTRTGSSPPTRRRATPTGSPATTSPGANSPAACTRTWISTSGASS